MPVGSPHIVVLNIAAKGHINPTLPLVKALKERGSKVTYFVDEEARQTVEQVGAEWRPFRYCNGSTATGLNIFLDAFALAELVPFAGSGTEHYQAVGGSGPCVTRDVLPGLIEDLYRLSPPPAAILYDTLFAAGLVAAHRLGVPGIGFISYPGPGAIVGMTRSLVQLETKPWVDKPRQQIQKLYGVDIFKNAMAIQYYSPCLNIVATIEDLFWPPMAGTQTERFDQCRFHCVGALVECNTTYIPNFPGELRVDSFMEEVNAARADGKRVLYISLGTEAVGSFWTFPMGHTLTSGNDEGRPAGLKPLMAHTGKEFCQHVWRTCIDAFGNKSGLLVVMSVGFNQDALEGLPELPPNFIARPAVPQMEVLSNSCAFLTHAGANSLHEALSFGVPMIAVPMCSDQPASADAIAATGAGLSFRHPLRTLTVAALREAMGKVEDVRETNPFRAAAQSLKKKLEAADGVRTACDLILQQVASLGFGQEPRDEIKQPPSRHAQLLATLRLS